MVLGCILALLGIFVVPSIAHAGFGEQVFDMVMRVFASLMYLILYISAYLVSWLAKALDFLVRFQLDGNLFVVVELWKIVRDFANMFFIVILIIMAFATIFDVGMLNIPGLGGIDGRKLIAQFIIVALLINFSLTIGSLVIGAANAVNNVFLASIGDISNRLGQSLNPSYTILGVIPEKINTTSLRSTIPQASAELTTISHVVKMFFSVILTLIILFSLIVANFFALFRIPVIWMLLVFSPIAWLSSILPSTRKINQDWWAKFMGWNVYLPVFLFFLYFGLYFMSYQDRVIAGLAEGYTAKVVTGNDTFGDFALANLQTIFFYFIAAFTLIGGTSFAVKAASGGGKALENVVGWGKGFAEGLPVFNRYRAGKEVLQKEFQEIQKEGIGRLKVGGKELREQTIFGAPVGKGLSKLYEGEKGREALREKMGARLGLKGFEDDKLLTKKITDKKKDFREKDVSAEKLLGNLESLKNRTDLEGKAEYYASAEALLEKKRLAFENANPILERYKRDSKASAGAFQDRLADQIIDKANKESYQSKQEFDAAFNALPGDTRERFLRAAESRNMAWAVEARLGALSKEYADEVKRRKEKGLAAGKPDEAVLEDVFTESIDGTNPNRFRTKVVPIVDGTTGKVINPKSPEAEKVLIDALAGGYSNRDIQNLMGDPGMNVDAISKIRSKPKLEDAEKKYLDKVEKIYKALGLQLNEKRILDIGKNLTAQQRKNFDALLKDVMANIKSGGSYKADFDNLKKVRSEAKQAAREFTEAIGDSVREAAEPERSRRKGGRAGFTPPGSSTS